jgi:hypothetical protein
LLAVALYSVYAVGYRTADSYVYLIPVYLVVALWLGRGLLAVATAIQRWATGRTWRFVALRPLALVVVGMLLVALPLSQYLVNRAGADLSGDQSARNYVDQALAALPAAAMVVTASDEHTFALWYGQATRGRSDLVVVDRDLTQFEWYREQLRQRVPDLAGVADAGDPGVYVKDLVSAARLTRPIFLADADQGLQQAFRWQDDGVVSRLVGPGGQ